MIELELVSVEKLADTETPVSAYVKLCRGRADSFLLESVETKDVTGRYSIVAYDPIAGMELEPDRGTIWNGAGRRFFDPADFFATLRSQVNAYRLASIPAAAGVGSFMGFVGYDAVRLIERLPGAWSTDVPASRLVMPSRFAIFDHVRRTLVLTAIDTDARTCCAKIADMEQALGKPLSMLFLSTSADVIAPPKDRFCSSVETAKEYIRAGDIFQVVVSDSFTGRSDLDPFEMYRRLRVKSPSPYMFYLDLGSYRLLGASPETLVKVGGGTVTIMPIAGTRGRGSDPARDGELERELLESDKEAAEHLMLVDLARNDVGRVSAYGTVTVDPFRAIHRYSHVMHIVSQVQGRLRDDADIIDAFTAGFPAGTVSGAPKVRAMEIIDELEVDPRGPYAGAVGYFGPNGVMDTCIAIRCALFHEDRFDIRVGAGIVADSIPEMEYKEIQNKAAQSIAALTAAAEGRS